MILAALFGLGLTTPIHMGINGGLKPVCGQARDISRYMPVCHERAPTMRTQRSEVLMVEPAIAGVLSQVAFVPQGMM